MSVITCASKASVCVGDASDWGTVTEERFYLRFDSDDPFCVTMITAGVPWEFDKELLFAGINLRHITCGDGDVKIVRHANSLQFRMSNDNGMAIVVTEAGPVEQFIANVRAEVPDGAEEWDAELESWLLDVEREEQQEE